MSELPLERQEKIKKRTEELVLEQKRRIEREMSTKAYQKVANKYKNGLNELAK